MTHRFHKLGAAALIASGLFQARAQAPEFEAASVKLAEPDGSGITVHFTGGGPGTPTPGLFRCMNCTASELVMKAYEVESYQVSGPDALHTPLEITAKIPFGATQEQMRLMLQKLLADRFKLAFHREKRSADGYDLVVVKDGPKLKEPQPDPDPATPPVRLQTKVGPDHFVVFPPGQPAGRITTFRNGDKVTTAAGRASTGQLALELTRSLHQPVVDATGLSAKYEFVLYWVLEDLPTLQQALQKLGLKLERKKISADAFIVDHVEKVPVAN